MNIPDRLDDRIRYMRVMSSRFAPIVASGISEEWDEVVSRKREWGEVQDVIGRVTDPGKSVGLSEVQVARDLLGELLDLWEEDPVGSLYYPYDAAVIVEYYCRMAVGDFSDNSPISLAELGDRFAGHVDWELARNNVNIWGDGYFRDLEIRFQNEMQSVSRVLDSRFESLMEKSKEASTEYVRAIYAALYGSSHS